MLIVSLVLPQGKKGELPFLCKQRSSVQIWDLSLMGASSFLTAGVGWRVGVRPLSIWVLHLHTRVSGEVGSYRHPLYLDNDCISYSFDPAHLRMGFATLSFGTGQFVVAAYDHPIMGRIGWLPGGSVSEFPGSFANFSLSGIVVCTDGAVCGTHTFPTWLCQQFEDSDLDHCLVHYTSNSPGHWDTALWVP